MNFREYRRKETIRAAEINEAGIQLTAADKLDTDTTEVFDKGDYVENRNGKLIGWKKGDFEAAFTSVRAPRQSKQVKPRRKAATAATSNE